MLHQATATAEPEHFGELVGLCRRCPDKRQGPPPRESTSETHQGSGIFGVQYTPHRRFAVFRKLGCFSTSESSAALGLQFDNRTFGTLSRVGVVCTCAERHL